LEAGGQWNGSSSPQNGCQNLFFPIKKMENERKTSGNPLGKPNK